MKNELFPADTTRVYKDLDEAHSMIERVNKLNEEQKSRLDPRVVPLVEAKFDSIEMSLKKEGAIPTSPDEEIDFILDREYPKTKNREVVTLEGNKYQLIFSLVAQKNDGTKIWKREWRRLDDVNPAIRKELFPVDNTTLEVLNALNQELENLISQHKEDDGETVSWIGRMSRRSNRIDEIKGLIYRAEITLKKKGLLESTPDEQLSFKLDKIGGDLRRGDVLEYEGKFYRLDFYPLAKSNSGKSVHVWARNWYEVEV